MSTQFDDSFVNGDIIEAEHVKQVFTPIKDLESGAAFYREASGTGAPYVVDFTATPGVKKNFISTTAYDPNNDLQPGQIITFKANVNSPASASLQLVLEDGSSGTNSSSFPLNAGNSQVGADQILAGQIVVAVYNDQSGGRFDVSSVAPAPGSTSLDDLSDVAISSPAGGDIMLYNGTSNQFENGTLSSAGIVQQSRAVNVSSPLTGGGDLSADVSVGIQQASGSQDGYLSSTDHAAFSAKQDALGGSGDVPGLTAELANKSDVGHTHSAADITSGTLAVERGGTGADLSATGGTGQVLKQSTSGGAVTVGALAASDMPTGIDPAKLSPGTVDSTEFGYLNGVTGAIQTQIDGKAAVSHTHSISEITSGTLPLDQGGTGSDLSATGGTGQFLKQSTSGGNVTVGALSAGEMPSGIDAAKVSSGNVSNTEFDYLDGVTNPIQTQLDGKAPTSHNHAASDITSGQIAIAQGGTGADLSATGGTGQFLKQNTSGGNVTVGALSAGEMPSGIDASRVGSGNVSNTEFDYLDGVTSPIQNQLDGKAATAHTHDASDIVSGTVSVARGGTGLTSLGDARRLLYSTSASAFGTLAAGSTGQVLYMGASAPYWGNPPATGVTGYGSYNRLAIWNSSNNITYNSNIYVSGSALYAYGFTSTNGSYGSSTGQTHLPNLRNQAFSAALYWDSSTKEVGYLFSRAAHKKNIKTIESSMDELMKWRPVTFEWKEAFGGKPDLGLISEEVEAVFPLAASYDQDWEYTDEETGEYVRDEDHMPKKIEGTWVPAGVKYERAWLPMLAAVQDFYRKYQDLEKKFEKLEAQVGKQK